MTHFEQFLGLSQIVAQTFRSASFMWALPPALSADKSESLHTDTLHTLSLPAVEAEDSARKAESGRKKKKWAKWLQVSLSLRAALLRLWPGSGGSGSAAAVCTTAVCTTVDRNKCDG